MCFRLKYIFYSSKLTSLYLGISISARDFAARCPTGLCSISFALILALFRGIFADLMEKVRNRANRLKKKIIKGI